MKMLFEDVFCPEDVRGKGYGNVLSATASLQGWFQLNYGEMNSIIGIATMRW